MNAPAIRLLLAASAAALLAAWPAADAHAESGPAALADFESALDPASIRVFGLSASRDDSGGSAACGKACLSLRPAGSGSRKDGESSVTILLPANADPSKSRALSAWIRADLSEEPLRLRWLALDVSGREVFQRRFFFDGGDVWHRIEWPLVLWRWSDEGMGDWSEVKSLSLAVESRDWSAIWIDDLRLEPGADGQAGLGSRWLLGAAFGARKAVCAEAHGFMAATDAQVGKEALAAVLDRLKPLPEWISRTFGKAVRPLPGRRPVALLVFDDKDAYKAFFKRLGTAWRVNISPPKSGGYTVFDIATSYYDASKGFDRPVYFHEAVHAAIARNVRLVPGSRLHSWLQEAVANYLQLCLFPDSLGREVFVRAFAERPKPDGKGFFKPLRILLPERIGPQHYAQLASFFAFLVEKHPDFIPGIAGRASGGAEPAEAIAGCGLAADALEAEWLAWGAEMFKPGTEKSGEPHFPVPPEWKPR